MKIIIQFVRINIRSLIGVSLGIFLGYLHWFLWGCYWGTYPLSSECWVNCTYGGLLGGLTALVVFNNSRILNKSNN